MKNYLRMFFTRGVACAALLMHVTQLSICDDNVTETADGKVTLVADGYQFTEGPAVDSEGVVFFTDQPNDRILRVDLEGKGRRSHLGPGLVCQQNFCGPIIAIRCS